MKEFIQGKRLFPVTFVKKALPRKHLSQDTEKLMKASVSEASLHSRLLEATCKQEISTKSTHECSQMMNAK